jgi:hypothetical protein
MHALATASTNTCPFCRSDAFETIDGRGKTCGRNPVLCTGHLAITPCHHLLFSCLATLLVIGIALLPFYLATALVAKDEQVHLFYSL